MSSHLVDYSFAARLYQSLHVIERAGDSGTAVISTEWDVVFQLRKIERSGLCEAVGEQAMIDIHLIVQPVTRSVSTLLPCILISGDLRSEHSDLGFLSLDPPPRALASGQPAAQRIEHLLHLFPHNLAPVDAGPSDVPVF